MIGRGNLAVKDGLLVPKIGLVAGQAPGEAGCSAAVDGEPQRMAIFLGL